MGCGKPKPKIVPAPENAPYAIMDFNSQYITLLSNDTVAIDRCIGEVLDTGNDRGPICQNACTTGDLLIKFDPRLGTLLADCLLCYSSVSSGQNFPVSVCNVLRPCPSHLLPFSIVLHYCKCPESI